MASSDDERSGVEQNGPTGDHRSCKNAFPKSRGSADVPETATEDPRRGSEPRTTTERQRLEAQPGRPGGQAPGTTSRIQATQPEAERPSLLLVTRVGSRPTATRNAGRVDPTIRTGAVGDGTPTGTRSRESCSIPGRPKPVVDELANPLLRKRQAHGQGLTDEPRTRDPELRGKVVDAAQLPAGQPDPDRPIERLQVTTGNRHKSLRLVWREVGVPIRRDVTSIRTCGQDHRKRLGHRVVKIVRADGKGPSMSMKDIAKGVGVGPLTSDPNAFTKSGELQDGILDRQ